MEIQTGDTYSLLSLPQSKPAVLPAPSSDGAFGMRNIERNLPLYHVPLPSSDEEGGSALAETEGERTESGGIAFVSHAALSLLHAALGRWNHWKKRREQTPPYG